MLKYDNLKTDDLILEPVSKKDINDIKELFDDKEYHKYFTQKNSEDEREEILQKIIDNKANDRAYNWGIYKQEKSLFNRRKKKGKLIGLILFENSKSNKIYSRISNICLSVITNKLYANKKVATNALNCIVDYLIDKVNFEYVTTWMSPYNYKSVKLFKRLGFICLGINGSENVVFVKTKNIRRKKDVMNFAREQFVPINFSHLENNSNYKKVFEGFPKIETENLLMTNFVQSDSYRYRELLNQKDIANEFNGPISLEDAENLLTYSFPKGYLECEYITWVIKLKDSGEIIGLRDLYIDKPDLPVVTQGFVDFEHRNQGYHQEGLNACISFLKDSGFGKLITNCDRDNLIAQHILDKHGFKEVANSEGTNLFLNPQNRLKFYLEI